MKKREEKRKLCIDAYLQVSPSRSIHQIRAYVSKRRKQNLLKEKERERTSERRIAQEKPADQQPVERENKREARHERKGEERRGKKRKEEERRGKKRKEEERRGKERRRQRFAPNIEVTFGKKGFEENISGRDATVGRRRRGERRRRMDMSHNGQENTEKCSNVCSDEYNNEKFVHIERKLKVNRNNFLKETEQRCEGYAQSYNSYDIFPYGGLYYNDIIIKDVLKLTCKNYDDVGNRSTQDGHADGEYYLFLGAGLMKEEHVRKKHRSKNKMVFVLFINEMMLNRLRREQNESNRGNTRWGGDNHSKASAQLEQHQWQHQQQKGNRCESREGLTSDCQTGQVASNERGTAEVVSNYHRDKVNGTHFVSEKKRKIERSNRLKDLDDVLNEKIRNKNMFIKTRASFFYEDIRDKEGGTCTDVNRNKKNVDFESFYNHRKNENEHNTRKNNDVIYSGVPYERVVWPESGASAQIPKHGQEENTYDGSDCHHDGDNYDYDYYANRYYSNRYYDHYYDYDYDEYGNPIGGTSSARNVYADRSSVFLLSVLHHQDSVCSVKWKEGTYEKFSILVSICFDGYMYIWKEHLNCQNKMTFVSICRIYISSFERMVNSIKWCWVDKEEKYERYNFILNGNSNDMNLSKNEYLIVYGSRDDSGWYDTKGGSECGCFRTDGNCYPCRGEYTDGSFYPCDGNCINGRCDKSPSLCRNGSKIRNYARFDEFSSNNNEGGESMLFSVYAIFNIYDNNIHIKNILKYENVPIHLNFQYVMKAKINYDLMNTSLIPMYTDDTYIPDNEYNIKYGKWKIKKVYEYADSLLINNDLLTHSHVPPFSDVYMSQFALMSSSESDSANRSGCSCRGSRHNKERKKDYFLLFQKLLSAVNNLMPPFSIKLSTYDADIYKVSIKPSDIWVKKKKSVSVRYLLDYRNCNPSSNRKGKYAQKMGTQKMYGQKMGNQKVLTLEEKNIEALHYDVHFSTCQDVFILINSITNKMYLYDFPSCIKRKEYFPSLSHNQREIITEDCTIVDVKGSIDIHPYGKKQNNSGRMHSNRSKVPYGKNTLYGAKQNSCKANSEESWREDPSDALAGDNIHGEAHNKSGKRKMTKKGDTKREKKKTRKRKRMEFPLLPQKRDNRIV
ncbi:conserved Plasmodium protein, unknown function [Plasmodium ovale wallikeri]|uniref:Uncharacterized protein n=1 Tax=Plasmodium ovale wallikeri TaxID=864142 RepID=A0A1A8YHJ9_PLAOA|nr:conserved Plasmodium protein, unknown function [Plasmodium ovale wallikeri]